MAHHVAVRVRLEAGLAVEQLAAEVQAARARAAVQVDA
jgi:hypothetical protein